MKKIGIIAILCTIALVAILGTSFSVVPSHYALVPTKLYKEADFSSEILADIPKNQLLGNVTQVSPSWWQVTVYGKTGYVDNAAIYATTTVWENSYTSMRVDAGGFSQEIAVYYYPTADSPVYTMLRDNTKLEVATSGVDYGEYSEVILDGNKYYILDNDLTTGLTYSQIVGIILGVISGILVLALIFLLIYGFRRKLR